MAKKEEKTEQRSGRIVGRRYRYTDDYQILPALGGPGARGKRVVYIAPWTVLTLDAQTWQKLVRALQWLTALAVLGFVAAFCAVPPPMENKWYVPVLAIAAFPLAYQVMGAVSLPREKKPLERQQYDKSFVRVHHSAVFAFVILCLSALCFAVCRILTAAGVLQAAPLAAGDAAFAALLVLMAAAELLIRRLCRGIKTDTLENSAYSG